MKIQVKRRVGTKWRPVNINELVGTSILNFILDSKDDMIAALYQDGDQPVAFVANEIKHLDRYKETGQLLMTAIELKELCGTEVAPPLVARLFPKSSLIGIEYEDKSK